jgi:hypothetical protein
MRRRARNYTSAHETSSPLNCANKIQKSQRRPSRASRLRSKRTFAGSRRELAPPAPSKREDRPKRDFTVADELDGMPRSLAALLFGIAYLTAIFAFSGVIYVRGLALVYAHIIGYPVLIGAMAVLGCLLVPLSRKVFRKLRV